MSNEPGRKRKRGASKEARGTASSNISDEERYGKGKVTKRSFADPPSPMWAPSNLRPRPKFSREYTDPEMLPGGWRRRLRWKQRDTKRWPTIWEYSRYVVKEFVPKVRKMGFETRMIGLDVYIRRKRE